mmetsp:Transcript_20528/g.28518  ORF Transcript_20528/g.28518 Transcript_20528/m.28518 type:complete len:227 (-) Transcript_20528:863-1543(-)
MFPKNNSKRCIHMNAIVPSRILFVIMGGVGVISEGVSSSDIRREAALFEYVVPLNRNGTNYKAPVRPPRDDIHVQFDAFGFKFVVDAVNYNMWSFTKDYKESALTQEETLVITKTQPTSCLYNGVARVKGIEGKTEEDADHEGVAHISTCHGGLHGVLRWHAWKTFELTFLSTEGRHVLVDMEYHTAKKHMCGAYETMDIPIRKQAHLTRYVRFIIKKGKEQELPF